MRIQQVLFSVLIAFTLSACTDHSKPNVEVIQDLMENPAVKAQEFDEWSLHHSGMRVPPENTAPVGFHSYKCSKNLDCAAAMVNPMAGQETPVILTQCQKLYETNCALCHGFQGKGDGTVAAKMNLKPPTLLSDKVKGWKDGQLYHVITEGQGLMGSYASHVPQESRWQVVNYIRFLQKQ